MKVLVVVDMENDFLTGSLRNESAIKIIPNVVKKIEEYKSKRYPIFLTRDTHHEDYLDTQEGKKLPVEHCIENTWGWDFCDEVKQAIKGANYVIVDKETFGSLYLSLQIDYKLIDYVDELDIPYEDEEKTYNDIDIEIVGVCTDICVISNAIILKAYYKENKIIVDASCCAGITPESHKNALETMKMCQIEIIND